jgi:tetratricopeptide (TPR) repeat protein
MEPKSIDRIFWEAAQLDATERDAYLERACAGDSALRCRLEQLLRAIPEAESFLESPTPDLVATVVESITEQPGTVIGPYKLIEQIGEGGFGVVFMAEQSQPIRRKVALKILKPGMDTRQITARFEAERQALAIMDHPNIAKVFDGGATASGRPYFVMELVKGVPVTNYCDQAQLTPRERLELFLHVCQAVQHAHQKGIIHRDIKPSNVLVTLHNGTAEPKIIDFGVAKALAQQLTDKTLVTGFAQMIGTPLYMSPEQAALSNVDVDTRSDIYSLGVLLYELLTGTTPFEKARFHQAGYDELLRIIRVEEPPRPSTRISTLGQAATTVSAQRRSDPKRLRQLLRGELDWIVMKALEKDRNRRYETASAFAADVQRYLNDEAVQACPPSAWYRWRKFARRHRAAVAIVTAVAGALLLVASTVAGSIAWNARDRAAHRAETERLIVGMLDESVSWQQKRQTPEALAAARRAAALRAGAAVGDRLTKRVLARLADLELLDRLENIRQDQETAIKDDGFDLQGAEALYRQTFQAAGLDVEGVPSEEAAERIGKTTIAVELAAALDHWAWLRRRIKGDQDPGWKNLLRIAWTADQDEGRRRLRQALARGDRQALVAAAAAEEVFHLPVPTLAVLGSSLVQDPDTRAEAEAFLRGAQRQYPNDFWLNCNLAHFLANTPPYRLEEAVRFSEAAVALRPRCAAAHYNLGCNLCRLGKPDEAIAQYRQALRLHENYARAHNNLGNALLDVGLGKEAIAEYREALRLQNDSALFHNNLGNALLEQDQLEQAIAEFHEAIRLNKDLSIPHANLGAALCEKGLFEEAIAECREAVRLEKDSPLAHTNLGKVLGNKGLVDEAIAECREAIRLKKDYAVAHSNLGAALADKGLADEAIASCRQAIRLKKDYAPAHNNLGVALEGKGLVDEAVASYREAIRLKKNYAAAHNNLGAALRDKGRRDEAIAEFREAIRLRKDFAIAHLNLGLALADKDLLDDAIAEFREAARLKPDFAEAHNNLGKALSLKGPEGEAIAELRAAIRLKENYAEAHYNLGVALRKRGLLDEAITEFREAIRLKEDYAEPHNNLGNALREKGLPQEAIAEFREAIRVKQDYADPRNNLGLTLADQRLIDDAIAAYREAILLKKDFAEARSNLGNALSHKGLVVEAIAELREAIRLKNEFAEAHNNLGVALRKNRQLDEAIAAFREAVRLKPDVATFHNNLGNALVAKGLVDEAIAAYHDAIRLQKNFAPAHYNLGIALARNGKLDEAIAAYRNAIHFGKDYAEAHCNLGLLLMETEQFAEAVEELRIGHQLGSRKPGWPYPSQQWLRKAETLAQLPALLKGEAKPAGIAERLLLADFCLRHKRACATAARWYGEAFAAEPELLANPSLGHRFNAACAAALAGIGEANDRRGIKEEERAAWRKQALAWLRDDLKVWGKLLEDAGSAVVVRQHLEGWLKAGDLSGVRGEALAKLPESERQPWCDLWADVDKTLATARQQTTPERK